MTRRKTAAANANAASRPPQPPSPSLLTSILTSLLDLSIFFSFSISLSIALTLSCLQVEALKNKLESVDRFTEMIDATHKLRLQQDEQVKLQDRLKEQKAQLLQAEHRLNAMVARLNEKRVERANTTNVQELLGKLEVEVAELEKQALESLPQQLQQKQRRMEELQHVLGEAAASDAELAQLQQQHQQLNRAVQQLEERKRSTRSDPDDKLAMFKQQANLTAKKKETLVQRLSSVGRERAAIEQVRRATHPLTPSHAFYHLFHHHLPWALFPYRPLPSSSLTVCAPPPRLLCALCAFESRSCRRRRGRSPTSSRCSRATTSASTPPSYAVRPPSTSA